MNDENYLVCQLKVNRSEYSYLFENEFENEVSGLVSVYCIKKFDSPTTRGIASTEPST